MSMMQRPPPGGPMVGGRYPPPPQGPGTPQQHAAMRSRMGGPMMQPGTPMVMQAQQHQNQQNAARQQLQRKKKRYADKLVPPTVRELVPESQAYMDLLAFEQKLDSTIMRKKLYIQEALKRPLKVKKRLRIYISHTFTPGKEPEKEGDEPSVPMWELRVEGRLMEELMGGAAANPPTAQPTNRPQTLTKRKFSSFFKSLVIELDKDIYGPDNHLVEWHRTPMTNETDGFQVKRPGDKPVSAKIMLLLDYQPMRYKLHPRLAKLLGFACDTRPKIIEALWQYIKTHNLQDPVDRDQINCDHYLMEIFGHPKIRFMEIPQRIQTLLQQPDHLTLEHKIAHGEYANNTACFDIDVEVDDPLKQNMTTFLTSQANAPELAGLDQKIYDIVDQINEWKTRRDFYVRFADAPHDFVQQWLISQSQDLRGMSEYSGEGEQERRADNYFQPVVQEGVFRYIYQKVQMKRAELEQSLGVRNNGM